MSEYTLLENRFEYEKGLQYLQVLRIGAPVDLADIVAQFVPLQSQDWILDFGESCEGKTIQRHKLEIYYPYRDAIRLRPQGWTGDESELVAAIFWRRTGRERLSAIIQDAADTYWARYDAFPGAAFVPGSSKNIPEQMTLHGCCEGIEIPIRAAAWLPRASVIVCGWASWMLNQAAI
jgi:hypothetical protein